MPNSSTLFASLLGRSSSSNQSSSTSSSHASHAPVTTVAPTNPHRISDTTTLSTKSSSVHDQYPPTSPPPVPMVPVQIALVPADKSTSSDPRALADKAAAPTSTTGARPSASSAPVPPLTLEDVLASPVLARHFQTHLVRTHAEENAVFVARVREARAAHTAADAHAAFDPRVAHHDARTLLDEFLAHTSALELNLPQALRRRVLRAFRARDRALRKRDREARRYLAVRARAASQLSLPALLAVDQQNMQPMTVPSTPTTPTSVGRYAGNAPAARVLGTVNVMTVHPPALPSTPAPVPASMLPLGTLIPDNVATVQAPMPASFDDARSVRSVSTVATTARLTDLDESGDDDDDAVPLHQPPVDAVRAAELAEGEAALASAQAYFEMFDEVEAHVVDLLVPRIKSFLTELSKTAEWLVRAPERTQKRVVIIGGGFCGSLVARLLDRFEQFQVCLIDAKPYSEYTAAIIRMIPNPMADSITIPHASYIRNGQFVLGYVDAVYKDHVLLQSSAPGAAAAGTAAAANDVLVGKRIPFDYCVLATGSSYASSVKAANISSTYRARKLQYDYAKLAKARTVLVIGGGSVGVEIASEIASVFGTPRVPIPPESTSSTTPTSSSGARSTSPSPFRRGSASTTATRATSPPVVKHPVKRIILVDANPRLLKRCPPRASQKALAYMRDVLGIDVVLGERITHHDARAGVFRARSGREFRADVVYLATGPVPQTQCMEPAFAHLLTGPNAAVMPSASTAPHHVDDAARASSTSNFFVGAGATAADAAAAGHMVPRRVLVRATHQIPTLPHIFVGGDCCATAEEKMALTAQCAAITIARNIVRLDKGKPPIERGAKGTKPLMPNPAVNLISMGRHSALAIINGVVFLGPKYLRMKWDELKVKYFEYLQSPSDSVPRVLKMMWGKGPTPPRSKSSARTAMLSPYYESEDAASVHSGSENATLAGTVGAGANPVAHDLKRESSMSTLASAATQQFADHPTMVLKMRARAAQQSQYEAELAAAAAAEGGEWHAGTPLPPPPMREAPPVPSAPVRKLVPRIAMAGGRALPTGEDVAALEEVLRAVGLVVPDVGGASKLAAKE